MFNCQHYRDTKVNLEIVNNSIQGALAPDPENVGKEFKFLKLTKLYVLIYY